MNPLLTSALVSTGQQVIEHCLASPETAKATDGEFDKVLNQKIHDDFDVAQYLHDNSLQSPQEVAQHVSELKARLLENRDFSDTALPHLSPESAKVVRTADGYRIAAKELEIPVETGSQAYSMARTIHHLEIWLKSR
mgnify:CR=1 FL=1|tara:strand:+ start:78 stop:488 length:411 start_codon:yes stop_codon:yes gene_type:complete